MRVIPFVLPAFVILAACGSDDTVPPGTTGGDTNDASAPGNDGSTFVDDSGNAAHDSSSPVVDSGRPAVDSGKPAADGGKPAVDSGSPVVDGSIPVSDSGTAVVDGGPNTASLACNGSGQVLVAEAADLSLAGDFTVEAWFKDDDPGGFNHDSRTIVSKSGEPEVPYRMRVRYNQLEVGHVSNYDVENVGAALGSFMSSAWHHGAATYDAASRVMRAYVDGQLKTNPDDASSKLAAQVGAADTGHPLTLTMCSFWAAFAPYGPKDYWQGKIDDVRIWSVRRTDAEIAANYQSELSGPQPGLVAYYTFDEGSGTVAHDSSGKGHDGMMETGTSFSTEVHP
jgi:hypothetical protein